MSNVSIAQRFALFACNTPGIPPEVLRVADRAMMDTLGAVFSGSSHDTVRAVAGAWARKAGAATICDGRCTDAEGAALINGTAAHAWDIDDTSYTGIMHGSAVILPAILAVAQEVDADRDAVRRAFVVGSEISYVLGDICTHAHYFHGWWSTATLSIVGATAAIGSLLRLDQRALTDAIALSAAAAGCGKVVFGTDCKPFLVGETARRAIVFARAGEAGLHGPANAFEDDRGYLKLMSGGRPDVSQVETLGRRWRLIHPGLLFKTSPVCSAAHAAIEQMTKLMRASGAKPNDIAEIRAEVPELVFISLLYPDPQHPQQAQFSLPYALACAALHGRVRFEDLSKDAIAAPEKRTLMAKVNTFLAADLSTTEMRKRYPESARLTLLLKDGRVLSGFCGSAYGMPDRPLSDDDLVRKFRQALTFSKLRVPEVDLDEFDPVWTIANVVPAGCSL